MRLRVVSARTTSKLAKRNSVPLERGRARPGCFKSHEEKNAHVEPCTKTGFAINALPSHTQDARGANVHVNRAQQLVHIRNIAHLRLAAQKRFCVRRGTPPSNVAHRPWRSNGARSCWSRTYGSERSQKRARAENCVQRLHAKCVCGAACVNSRTTRGHRPECT